MNEAELEQRMLQHLQRAFPVLPGTLRLERYLHLHMGHHDIILDGQSTTRNKVMGRLDAVVYSDDKPLILFELKAPNVSIEEGDILQGLSYARTHQPVVPIVTVTNGKDVVIRRAYDGAALEPGDLGAERLKNTLDSIAAIATKDLDWAIRTLLGSSHTVWNQLFDTWSKWQIDRLMGNLRDLSCPIPREFVIKRDLVRDVDTLLASDRRLIVVHGKPLCGITNALVQICTSKAKDSRLYIEGSAQPDILQYIANKLARELNIGITKNDIRAWLNSSRGEIDITLVVDGVPGDGLDELVEMADTGLLRLVLGVNTNRYATLSVQPGRSQKTTIGREAVALELKPLSDCEFSLMTDLLENSYRASFFGGAQYSQELREVRLLRVIASTLPHDCTSAAKESNTIIKLSPVVSLSTLLSFEKHLLGNQEIRNDFLVLAKAFLDEITSQATNVRTLLDTFGRTTIQVHVAEEYLGESRMKRMMVGGFLAWMNRWTESPRYMIRCEELLQISVAHLWAQNLATVSDQDSISALLAKLLVYSQMMVNGDVVLAYAIAEASTTTQMVMSEAIPYLLKSRPDVSRIPAGSRFTVLFEDMRLDVATQNSLEDPVIGGIHPWMALSHLASYPLRVQDESFGYTGNLPIFLELGEFSHLLRLWPLTTFDNVAALHFHDIPGLGAIPCAKSGIIEPLQQAMLTHTFQYPSELTVMADFAVNNELHYLAWRVLTVAGCAAMSADTQVRSAAEASLEVLNVWMRKVIRNAVDRSDEPCPGVHR